MRTFEIHSQSFRQRAQASQLSFSWKYHVWVPDKVARLWSKGLWWAVSCLEPPLLVSMASPLFPQGSSSGPLLFSPLSPSPPCLVTPSVSQVSYPQYSSSCSEHNPPPGTFLLRFLCPTGFSLMLCRHSWELGWVVNALCMAYFQSLDFPFLPSASVS